MDHQYASNVLTQPCVREPEGLALQRDHSRVDTLRYELGRNQGNTREENVDLAWHSSTVCFVLFMSSGMAMCCKNT